MKLRVIIITSTHDGLAAHHLPFLTSLPQVEVAAVLVSGSHIKSKSAHYKRKFKKVLQIGLLGTLNGFRMRKWFGSNVAGALGNPSLHHLCRQHQVPLLETSVLNSEATKIILREGRFDLGISLGNGFIAPSVFSIPRLGMINIHHEILPAYQNAQSVIWQLYHGSVRSGYTIHVIERKIDAGAILWQQWVPIVFKQTLGETVTATVVQLYHQSAIGLSTLLGNYAEYREQAIPQGEGNSFTTPSIYQYFRMVKQFKRLKNRVGETAEPVG